MFDIQSQCHPAPGASRLQSGPATWSRLPVQGWVRERKRSVKGSGGVSCRGQRRPSGRRKPGAWAAEEGRLRPAQTFATATFSGRKWILPSLQQRPDSGQKKSRGPLPGSFLEREAFGSWSPLQPHQNLAVQCVEDARLFP